MGTTEHKQKQAKKELDHKLVRQMSSDKEHDSVVFVAVVAAAKPSDMYKFLQLFCDHTCFLEFIQARP
jgi:hypothetical protein